jgi:RHS repeat-associated protein
VKTTYLVDTQNPTGYAQVVTETSGNTTRQYVLGLERVSERIVGGTTTTRFYDYDGHGSVRALTDTTGVVTDTYDYDAFGNLIHSTGATPNNYLYSGEQFDPDLNLYYNRARYLNTATGRFWSMDSFDGYVSDPLSLHKYLYCFGSVPNCLDPSGQDGDYGSTMAAVADGIIVESTPLLNFLRAVSLSGRWPWATLRPLSLMTLLSETSRGSPRSELRSQQRWPSSNIISIDGETTRIFKDLAITMST